MKLVRSVPDLRADNGPGGQARLPIHDETESKPSWEVITHSIEYRLVHFCRDPWPRQNQLTLG